ncbi:cytidylate kinase [Phycicoccus badiiscoriae]|uniref:Cytidylate kinase n=1 Tax=Pedococcus badiiscoriae TaxID=642776 RepID=A0A852WHH3_9MICO|nr:AAA family ATPase [Pedococcus badiiscoriae]NYG08320.1 cytidylate kinase [Pedococcus badiiscoriae]
MPSDQITEAVAAITTLVDASDALCGTTRLVCIDGPSGAGKTTLASAVAAALAAPTVHMDDLYPGWGGLRAGTQRAQEWIVGPLTEGLPARYRRWDWARDEYAEWVQLPSSEVIVIEGCGAGALPAGKAASVLVWVEAEESVRRARGVARDAGFAAFWEDWAIQERRLYEADRTWERADLFIDTTEVRQ